MWYDAHSQSDRICLLSKWSWTPIHSQRHMPCDGHRHEFGALSECPSQRCPRIPSGWQKSGEREPPASRFLMRCSATRRQRRDGLFCLGLPRQGTTTLLHRTRAFNHIMIMARMFQSKLASDLSDHQPAAMAPVRTTSPNPRRVATGLFT